MAQPPVTSTDPAPGDQAANHDTTAMSAQVAKAGTWGFAGRAILLLANFGATPFTVRLFGPSAYGLWALIQAILIWANLAEGGMWAATTRYGTQRYAAQDAVGESRVVWSGICFVLTTTVSVAIVLALGAHFLLTVLRVKGTLLGPGTWALRIVCVGLVLSALAGSINTAQTVRLRWVQYTFLNTMSNLVSAVGIPIALFLFSDGVVSAAAVTLFASSLYLIGLSWDAIRVQPALLHPRVDKSTLRQLLSYGWPLTLAGMATVPLSTGERFFLGMNTSTTAVAYYAVAMTIATTLQVLPEQLTSPLIPALTRLEAEGRSDEQKALYQKSHAGLFLVATPATILVALLAKPFLTLWAGTAYGAHSTLLLLIALGGVWISVFASVSWSYILSAGQTRTLAMLQGAEVVPYLAAAWVLTAKWGALGASVVWSARLVLDSVGQFVIVWRFGHLPVLPLSTRRARSVAAPTLFAAMCLGVAILSHGLLARSAIAVMLVLAYGAAVWWLVLTPNERHGIVNLLSEVLGRKVQETHQPW